MRHWEEEIMYQCTWCDNIGWVLELIEFENMPRINNLPCMCGTGGIMLTAIQVRGYKHSFHGKYPHGQYDYDESDDRSYNDVVMEVYHKAIQAKRNKVA